MLILRPNLPTQLASGLKEVAVLFQGLAGPAQQSGPFCGGNRSSRVFLGQKTRCHSPMLEALYP